jgi:hypothetical protein
LPLSKRRATSSLNIISSLARDADERIARLIAVEAAPRFPVFAMEARELSKAARMRSSCKRQEKIVAVLLLWAVPTRIFVGSTASYFVAMAEIMDSTLAIASAQSTATPRDLRRKFKVIEGGKR